ncbi:hypothetical protein [Bradyrhizobium sp. CCBAU 51753]|uniref:hypothetical protein n=1 Tax=Bradyrhizobium sp. CCBAU 51753 TaxID=1325100 RepID=UPI00188CFAA9|nr:hypothetical protein [Bradyrhizobium sp. CCBAU 51753]QOZ22621.1 hypothetical protein XH93_02355 [Bradyrhizobium sp. CCBAU 51753]
MPIAPNDFVQLERSFHELAKYARESDAFELNRAYSVGPRLHWDDLLKGYRTVVLSEAGTGKTVEIRQAAKQLRTEGKRAFFMRLEHISNDLEDAFEVGTFEEFTEWLASTDEAWLLLDSVDEARLRNPGDFELAVRKIGRRIQSATARAHIVLTGRASAWRARTDIELCERCLPFASEANRRVVHNAQEEGLLEDVLDVETVPTEHSGEEELPPVFRIVTLDDLSMSQIKVFAQNRGVTDTQAFLEEIERADAGSFTTRPQDLEELVDFWVKECRIGTRLELMQNSVHRRLEERDQNHREIQPLPAVRAREGARLLAAASILGKEPTIQVPDGSHNNKGIPVRMILSDWNDRDQQALLSRPILMQAYVREDDDISRIGGGVYSPGLRDNAQDARNALFNQLKQIPGKEAFVALSEIAIQHPKAASRPWLVSFAYGKAVQDADLAPWSPAQVRDFHQHLDRTPTNHRELADLAIMRLIDLQDDLENGDESVARVLRRVEETEMRNFLAHELRGKARGRYTITQEEELADAKRPDLRFHGAGFDAPVPAELKLAERWTGPRLFERLEVQLSGDYLRDNRSMRGIFVLVNGSNGRQWRLPSGDRVDFNQLLGALREHWSSIAGNHPNVEDITVIGIDLSKRIE